MNDVLTGGAGNTIFRLGFKSGKDTITDFGSRYFTATLQGSEQVPPVVSTATATGTVGLNRAHTLVTVSLTASGLDFDGQQTANPTDNVTGFHIHDADAGANGQIVWDIAADTGTVVNPVTGTVTSSWIPAEGLNDTLVGRLLTNGLYLNIHTVANGGGEIRGQLGAAAGDTGKDRIDVKGLNIGSFETIKEITADAADGAKITVLRNGVEASFKLLGILESTLKASDFVFAGNAAQSISGTAGVDTLFGAGGGDKIKGLAGNDRLFGETGNDTVDGGAGKDTLFGGAGGDKLIGGLGRDTMTGGAGADDFLFLTKADSGKTSASRDVIADFKHNLDDIDLSAIDANGSAKGNPAFSFLAAKGASFTHHTGEVRWFQQGSTKTVVEVDIDGNAKADFQIEFTGHLTLTKGDFVL